jgi:hypothetical protein
MKREIEVKFKSSYYGEFSEVFEVSNNVELNHKINEFLHSYMVENIENIAIYHLMEACETDYDSPFDE